MSNKIKEQNNARFENKIDKIKKRKSDPFGPLFFYVVALMIPYPPSFLL